MGPSPRRRVTVLLLLAAAAALGWLAPVDAAKAKLHPKRAKAEAALAVAKQPRRVPQADFEAHRARTSSGGGVNSTASGRNGRSLLQVRPRL
jgi:hypothetical protein